jgi:hypothetical protein
VEVTSGAPGLTFQDEAEARRFARELDEAIKFGYRLRRAEPPWLLNTARKGLDARLGAARGRTDSQVSRHIGPVQAAPGQIAASSDQPDTLVGTEMAARIARVDPRTVRKWIDKRLIDAVRGPRGEHLVEVGSLHMQISRSRKGDDER